MVSCYTVFTGPFHTGFKGPEPTGRPLGGYLVSRPVTKFNGQPSLPVLLVTEYCGLQKSLWPKLLVTEKSNGSFEQQENMWFTVGQFLLCPVRGQPSYK